MEVEGELKRKEIKTLCGKENRLEWYMHNKRTGRQIHHSWVRLREQAIQFNTLNTTPVAVPVYMGLVVQRVKANSAAYQTSGLPVKVVLNKICIIFGIIGNLLSLLLFFGWGKLEVLSLGPYHHHYKVSELLFAHCWIYLLTTSGKSIGCWKQLASDLTPEMSTNPLFLQ